MIIMQKQIKLVKRPIGLPTKEDFEFIQAPIAVPAEGEVLVRTVYISVDPYLRGRMNEGKSYIPPFELDSVIASGVIAQVVESKSTHFKKNDIVYMEGHLVNVFREGKGGYNIWDTSLARNDNSSDGGCEVFYVKKLQVGNKTYE